MIMIDIVTHTVNETKDFISTVRSVSCRFLKKQTKQTKIKIKIAVT